jgi:dCTP diphosphatase
MFTMQQQGSLGPISDSLADFAAERDWQQFHSPKNLAMALSVEVGELLEHFQWLTTEQSGTLDEAAKVAVGKEIADVQIYLIRLADQLGIDIITEVEQKMLETAARYPADLVRGSAKKYSEY